MGDVVLTEILRSRNLLPTAEHGTDYWVAADDESMLPDVMTVAGRLRAKSRSVEYALKSQSLSRQLKTASTVGVKQVVLLRRDDFASRWLRSFVHDLRDRLLIEVGRVPSHRLRRMAYRRAGIKLPSTSTIHFRAVGSTLTANIWPSSGTEPGTWMLTATDAGLTSGRAGLRLLTNTGTATITSFQANALS